MSPSPLWVYNVACVGLLRPIPRIWTKSRTFTLQYHLFHSEFSCWRHFTARYENPEGTAWVIVAIRRVFESAIAQKIERSAGYWNRVVGGTRMNGCTWYFGAAYSTFIRHCSHPQGTIRTIKHRRKNFEMNISHTIIPHRVYLLKEVTKKRRNCWDT